MAGAVDTNGDPVQPNEGARIQIAINAIDQANIAVRDEKILSGKTKILA